VSQPGPAPAKKCVKADSDKDATWAKHPNKWDYPAETGKDCTKINIEPGSYDCTKVLIPDSNPKKYKPHEFKNPSSGYNSKYDSEAWCTQKSCYVDPCKCNMKDFSASSWFSKPDGSPMYYSGQVCGGAFTFKAALCSGKTAKDKCNVDSGCIWDRASSKSAKCTVPVPPKAKCSTHTCAAGTKLKGASDTLNCATATCASTDDSTCCMAVPAAVSKPTKVIGKIAFKLTLPAGKKIEAVLADPAVKKGVATGIATKLGVNASWVTVVLTLDTTGARRLATESKINVAFTVTIPANTQTHDVKSVVSVFKASAAGSAATTDWGSALKTSINSEVKKAAIAKGETPEVYEVAVSAIVDETPTPAPVTVTKPPSGTCMCRKAKDVVDPKTPMPMDPNDATKYLYSEGDKTAGTYKSWSLADTWGATCNSWESQTVSLGFSVGWGCTAAKRSQNNHWCNDAWCYVNGCDCRDQLAIETLMWTGRKGLYFSYDHCCRKHATENKCVAKGEKCLWSKETNKCRQGSVQGYIENRCTQKSKTEVACSKWTSCQWDSASTRCRAASVVGRANALNCPNKPTGAPQGGETKLSSGAMDLAGSIVVTTLVAMLPFLV